MKNINDQIKGCITEAPRKTERGWEQNYVFPVGFVGFQGHFPGNPILPAIVQLMTARQSIAGQLGCEVAVTKVTRAKFHEIIPPEVVVTVLWNIRQQEDGYMCKCVLEASGKTAASFNLAVKHKGGQ
jgi:3-hydroxyacyl-[acyl-carrier-protein] dehydratase